MLPVWAIWFAFQLYWGLGDRDAWLPVYARASGATGYPIVAAISPHWASGGSLTVGDLLIRFGDQDLQGVGPMSLLASALEETEPGRRLRTVVQRGAQRSDVVLDLGYSVLSDAMTLRRRVEGDGGPDPPTTRAAVLGACFLGTVIAVLIMFRRPGAPVARWFFLGVVLAQFATGFLGPGPRIQTYALLALRVIGLMGAVPFGLRVLSSIPEELAPPRNTVASYWPWLFLPSMGLVGWSAIFGFPMSSETTWGMALPIVVGAAFASQLALVTRNYYRAERAGRRQLKWLLYSVYVLAVPPLLLPLLHVGHLPWLATLSYAVPFTWVLVPICILIAIAFYDLFDIDRLISVTASYTLLGVVLLAAVLVLIPQAAAAASSIVGIGRQSAELILALALAVVMVPIQARVRPQIDRLFFAERYALERGAEALLRTLAACADPEELLMRTGEGFADLLKPETCLIYTRAGEAFVPAFVRGRTAPPTFDAKGPLIATLEVHPAPLAVESWSGGHRSDLGPFERAALETLGAALVLPIRRSDTFVAFVCLGQKRSGDIYTSSDLALLGAIAAKVSGELLRFDYAEIARRAQAMQAALRRYVPGSVAAHLTEDGRGLESAEREVSVLFVDMRGYTTYAESRTPEEVFSTVNRYTEIVSAIVNRHGGTVVEFNGDGMMVVFGAPAVLPQKERAAVEAGREIIAAVEGMPPDQARGGACLSVGVGVATGTAFIGNIRSADRLIWTAIGNTANVAARLQGLTRELRAAMVIDAATWREARNVAADFIKHEEVPIRGRTEPQDVYVMPLA